MSRRFQFIGACPVLECDPLHDMVDHARPVTERTIRRHCVDLGAWCKARGYWPHSAVRLGKDWAVHFFKSRYKGVPCYYIDQASTENVWTLEGIRP